MVLDANLKNILRDFTGKLFPIDVVVGKPGSELLGRFGCAPGKPAATWVKVPPVELDGSRPKEMSGKRPRG
jgi:hypothetical protein